MTWRAPNRLRAIRRPLPERGVYRILAILAALIVALFAAAIAWIAIVLAGSRPARAYEIVVPPPCVELAAKFGASAPPTFTREQAEQALKQLGIRMIAVSEARACRAALIRALK